MTFDIHTAIGWALAPALGIDELDISWVLHSMCIALTAFVCEDGGFEEQAAALGVGAECTPANTKAFCRTFGQVWPLESGRMSVHIRIVVA